MTISAQTYKPSKGALENSFIIELNEKDSSVIFNNLSNYITRTYRDESSSFRGTIGDKFIRFTGVESNAIYQCGWCVNFTVRYTVAIVVKDGKIRVNLEQVDNGHGSSFNLYYFKKDGSLRKNKANRKSFNSMKSVLQSLLTDLTEAAEGNNSSSNW